MEQEKPKEKPEENTQSKPEETIPAQQKTAPDGSKEKGEKPADKSSEVKPEIKKDAQKIQEAKTEDGVQPVPEGEAPAQEKKIQEKKPVEHVRIANCITCNKTLKKGNWYYRNGKRYCNKSCWKTAQAKEAAQKKEQEKKDSK